MMGKVDFKLIHSVPILPDRSIREILRALTLRIVSSDFIRKVGETFFTRICLIGIGLAASVLIARFLGPEGRGLYAVAVAISAFGVQFGNLGLHASNTYSVARDKRLLPALIGNTILLSFAVGGLITVLLWVIFSRWPQFVPLDGLLFVLSLIWIPLGLASLLLQNLLLGIQEVHAYNKIELGTKLFGVGLLSLLAFMRTVTVEAFFSTGLVALVLSSLWALRRLNLHLTKPPHGSVALLKQNIGYGLKAYLAALFAFSVVRADLLMTKYILGAEETGYYSVAASMAELVYMLPVVVATILFPKLSALTDRKEQWAFTKRVAVATGIGMLFVLAAAGILAKPLIRLLYGELFLPSVPAFLWLLPGVFFLGVEIVVVQFLNSIGFPKIIVGGWALTCLFNIVLNLWAIPKYGITGASIVSSLSYFIICIFILWISWKTRQSHGSG